MLEYANRQDIRQRLWEELDKARWEHVAASHKLEQLVSDSPAGLPTGSRSALQDYMRALKRFTDFTLNGTVPEDLQPPVARGARDAP
jgi:hypothetical protein